jgi:acyl carrier protein
MDHVQKVRAFIIENFLYGEDGRITDETSFLGSSIIDSTGVLELVNYLEETFHITVDDDEVIPDNLDSLKNIDHYLKRKMNGTVQDAEGLLER